MLVAKKRLYASLSYYEQQHADKIIETARNNAKRAAKKITALGVLITFALMAILLIAHYAIIIQVNYQIGRATGELQKLQEIQQHLQLEVASLRSPQRLEKIALEELSMQYPDQSQLIILTAGRALEVRD